MFAKGGESMFLIHSAKESFRTESSDLPADVISGDSSESMPKKIQSELSKQCRRAETKRLGLFLAYALRLVDHNRSG
jgi:hypothetical protein